MAIIKRLPYISILILLYLFLSSSYSQAKEPDWKQLIEFRDTFLPGSVSEMWSVKSGIPPIAWKEAEKKGVIIQLEKTYAVFPGLFKRAATYGPVILYRSSRVISDAQGHTSDTAGFAGDSAIWLNDVFYSQDPSVAVGTFIHELAHILDAENKIIRSAEYRKFFEPRVKRVRELLKKQGITWKDAQQSLATNEGLPSPYASFSLQESLAEYVKRIMNNEYTPPADIKRFMDSKVLIKPQSVDQSILPFRKANTLYVAKKYDEALALVNEALKPDGDFVEAYILRGLIMSGKKYKIEAIRDFSRALDSMSEYDFEYLYVTGLRAKLCLETKDFNTAIADYTKVIAIRPDSQAYWYRALALKENKEIDKSISDLGEVIKLSPDYADAYCLRGELRRQSGELDKGIADFTSCIKLRPNDAGVYINRAAAWRLKKDPGAAISDLSEAIRLKPDNWYAFLARGVCYIDKSDFVNAKKDLEKALSLNPAEEETIQPWLKNAEDGLSKPKK